MKVKFEGFTAGDGDGAIGFRRTDIPLVHVIAKAPQGSLFRVMDHFSSCAVCRAHGATAEDFQRYMQAQGAGPFVLMSKDEA